ncbi:hypothetical protein [Paraburkholderia saeva]|uniref:hypothetical protein n=1 Tax=Paraburkholderia saeva TaxID=2777537 RepID=UPI001E2C6BBC|nr:hypothetical protein [Paraburkholderia saeva]
MIGSSSASKRAMARNPAVAQVRIGKGYPFPIQFMPRKKNKYPYDNHAETRQLPGIRCKTVGERIDYSLSPSLLLMELNKSGKILQLKQSVSIDWQCGVDDE